MLTRQIVRFTFLALLAAPSLASAAAPSSTPSPNKSIPTALQDWEGWATWKDDQRESPTPYFDPNKPLSVWPSRLNLQIDANGGRFDFNVTVFSQTWVSLPGGKDAWPLEVKLNGTALPVVEHAGRPALQLAPGTYRLEGIYRWNEIPQSLPLPSEIGVLALTLEGKPVEAPTWDAEGTLWLKRDSSSTEADQDFLATKVYGLLEDGIPLWLHTEIELVVSGKSREEELGFILPEGWKLASVESPIPVAVDDSGGVKAQVRAGKWTVRLNSFRLDNPKQFQFAADAKPAVEEELIAFQAKPDFRMVEITGSPSIDVSQTPFPAQWRNFPVYRWDTSTPFQIEERMRGMGLQQPEGLRITRELWLDENGRELTFRDRINGTMQQIWRLDAAPGQDLGSVRSQGQGQLITLNPQTDAPGVEIRTRNLNLEATGRMNLAREISATGWRSDADNLAVKLNLPPGWRVFALFGADWVQGDWLTSWSLLDLFLLLIFSLAVFRLWGVVPAILAFVAFGLSYHEPDAPRYIWLALLIPLALLRVVSNGWGHQILIAWKWVTLAVLVLILVPFVVRQVQQAIYPQLEETGYPSMEASFASAPLDAEASNSPAPMEQEAAAADKLNIQSQTRIKTFSGSWAKSSSEQGGKADRSNLAYDAKVRIQTGPGVPDWNWRTVSFGWNGPVQATQEVHPILISLTLERALALLRVALLLALAAILLDAKRLGSSLFRTPKAPVAALLGLALLIGATASTQAQLPGDKLIETLRTRLLEPSDAYPTAADIPTVALTLQDRKIVMDAEIHTAIRTAVPLPGRLPAWSPLSVMVDGKPEAALRRDDGYLWVVLPAGVHQVRVEGLLPAATEWEWSFHLKPHRVTVNAPDWTFTGLRADGVPEGQLFFARKQKSAAGAASYDRQDLQNLAVVERNLELGLVWQVRTSVRRVSPAGKAIALRIPLLPGENVISANAIVKDSFIEARLGSQDSAFSWESELPVTPELKLATKAEDTWVERWHLVASPVWNVAISGLEPTFEPTQAELIPVWHPWPGESVALQISRPEAIAGATTTINKAAHEITLGKRQRTSTLNLSVQSSLGEDFLIDLPADAEITSLNRAGQAIPVRKDGTKLIVPLQPGSQDVSIAWKINTELGFQAEAEAIQLPVESANATTLIRVPDDRWVLATHGPLRGPAVQFWVVLACSLLAAFVLARISFSPLRTVQWMLLAVGLTQVPLPAALVVIGWLFFLQWRGLPSFQRLPALGYNVLQVFLVGLTVASVGIFIAVVAAGLLGSPEMFIRGNGSSQTNLSWYLARSENLLPQPGLLSISIWFYRFLMLLWALWLAASLIRWLGWAWHQFSTGGIFHRNPAKPVIMPQPVPPPVPDEK